MPKKQKTSKKDTSTSTQDLSLFCQSCKFHSNNPSYCGFHKKHVGRKADKCDNYKRG